MSVVIELSNSVFHPPYSFDCDKLSENWEETTHKTSAVLYTVGSSRDIPILSWNCQTAAGSNPQSMIPALPLSHADAASALRLSLDRCVSTFNNIGKFRPVTTQTPLPRNRERLI